MEYICASCAKQGCFRLDRDNMPTLCPSRNLDKAEEAKNFYRQEPDMTFARESALQQIEATHKMSRLEETIDFIRRCGYKKVGIAFCKMVKNDAEYAAKCLREAGFTVTSTMCRAGAISNEVLEREGESEIGVAGYKSMCNPVGQALLLNEQGTEFNIVLGLCVGHDTMFFRHSEAPFTVLGVKDRKYGCTKVEL